MAVPSEHGGWALTLEPVLAGSIVATSWAGVCLGVAAFVAFLVRTPLKLVAVDRRRRRWLPRTSLALRVALAELVLLALLVALTAVLADDATWLVPLAAALPLLAVEAWFDVRSRSRRLLPELAGALGVAAVAPAIALAGGADAELATALWLVLAGRVVVSIPYVREQVARLHGRVGPAGPVRAGLAGGVVIAAAAVALARPAWFGASTVAALAATQVVELRHPPSSAKVLGLRQTLLGLAVVLATALPLRH